MFFSPQNLLFMKFEPKKMKKKSTCLLKTTENLRKIIALGLCRLSKGLFLGYISQTFDIKSEGKPLRFIYSGAQSKCLPEDFCDGNQRLSIGRFNCGFDSLSLVEWTVKLFYFFFKNT